MILQIGMYCPMHAKWSIAAQAKLFEYIYGMATYNVHDYHTGYIDICIPTADWQEMCEHFGKPLEVGARASRGKYQMAPPTSEEDGEKVKRH